MHDQLSDGRNFQIIVYKSQNFAEGEIYSISSRFEKDRVEYVVTLKDSLLKNPIYVLENIKIPLMVLNAEDDPVCSIKNLEPYKEVIQQMENIAVVTTKKGSHCGFYESLEVKSWASRLMADFFKHYS
jgi:pimeloyl-ACP methyl ester carboxylesterase